jgi:general secretion pathway protein E
MVGEIRDLETAEIAVQSSLTGHLVLSTLHTNSAVGAVTRLHDMGVEPFLLSTSLIGVLAQRLVRTLCPECKTAYSPDAGESELLGINYPNSIHIYKPKGCDQCGYSGYRGRSGIFELVIVDDHLRAMIHDGAAEYEIEKYARGFTPSIRQDGMKNILSGVTTLEEVLRVTRED